MMHSKTKVSQQEVPGWDLSTDFMSWTPGFLSHPQAATFTAAKLCMQICSLGSQVTDKQLSLFGFILFHDMIWEISGSLTFLYPWPPSISNSALLILGLLTDPPPPSPCGSGGTVNHNVILSSPAQERQARDPT